MLLPIVAVLVLPPHIHTDTTSGPNGGVRVWLPDTVLSVGALGRTYVQVRESGHLAVLHVEPTGRIRIVFPARPTDDDVVPAGGTFVVGGIGDSATFRVVGPGVGTLLAVRSWTPLNYDALRAGDRWDYANALLLQPTAGVPVAALLDIADRMADGEAFAFDVAEYRTPGAIVARRTPPDSVCFSCLAARQTGRVPAAPGTSMGDAPARAIDQSEAYLPGTYVVDCSDATVENALCGVQDNRSWTAVQAEVSRPAADAYPVYLPIFLGHRHLRRAARAPAPPPPAIALNLRRIPGRIVPPPPRRVAPIVVEQPHAPSRPWLRTAPQTRKPAATSAPAPRPTRLLVINAPRPPLATPVPAAGARGTPPVGFTMVGRPPRVAAPAATVRATIPTARAAFGQAPRPVIVPRR